MPLATAAVVALTAWLPFARGLLSGRSFYFRDLAGYFFPLRRFALEGLRGGELRFWNPYVHEGEPAALLPVGYPVDLLQLLLPGEWGLSLVLALHLPLAALTFALLLRACGRPHWIAGVGGLVYALGGFGLSTLNLYVYAQALAWAPLVVLGLSRAMRGDRRALAWAGVAVALTLSTTGLEILVQAVVIGLVLGWPERARLRACAAGAGSLLLGALLGAPTIAHMWQLTRASERSGGLDPSVVVSQYVHPFTFLQVVIGNLYGNLSNLANEWWGSNFFAQGFPYILSLYLGAATLGLAVAGLVGGSGLPRLRLCILAAAAGWICLGPFAGLDHVVSAAPFLRLFRFPVKAFYTLHVVVAFAAAAGLEALARHERRAWKATLIVCGVLGSLLAALPWLPSILPRATAWFLLRFFPPATTLQVRLTCLGEVLADARVGGLVALVAAGTAVLVLRRRLAPALGAALVGALIVTDLLRGGAGLNPSVTSSFYRLSSAGQDLADRLVQSDARVFTCDMESVPAYFRSRAARPRSHDAWTFAVSLETFAPYLNVLSGVRSGLTTDKTMLVPTPQVTHPDDAACSAVPRMLGRLRNAGITHVLSVMPLEHADLLPLESITNERLAPLTLHVYGLRDALPRLSVAADAVPAEPPRSGDEGPAGRATRVEGLGAPVSGAIGEILSRDERPGQLVVHLSADRPTVLVLRDAYMPGWVARVDGRPAPVLRADERHRAVPVPAGRSTVRLYYRPPGLRLPLALAAAALTLALGLLLRGARRTPAPTPADQGRN